MNPRLCLAILASCVASGTLWLPGDAYIRPDVWLLCFPAAFFSAWLAGLKGGLKSTEIANGKKRRPASADFSADKRNAAEMMPCR